MKIIHNITLLLLLLPFLATATETPKGKYSKEKKISKTFTVSANAALDVDNKYGTVYVTTWDQNQTVIDVVIKVTGDKQDQLDKRLNTIDVNFEASTSRVAATTKIGNFSGKVSMEINYTIKVPRKGTTDINNQYGNVILGKMDGRATVKVQYGSLTIDQLNAPKNDLNLQYSDGVNIGHLALTKISAQYSNLNIGQATDELSLTTDYTDINIESAKRLSINISYGEMKVNSVNSLSGRGDYSDIKLGTVSGMINYNTSYGDVKIGRLTKDVDTVFIKGEYSDINLSYDAAWTFDFTARTSYADVKGVQNFTMQEKKQGNTSGYYKGYYRSAGQAHVTLESEYGDITLAKL
jgi:hypothetical protein